MRVQLLSPDAAHLVGFAKKKLRQLKELREKAGQAIWTKNITVGEFEIYLETANWGDKIRLSGGRFMFYFYAQLSNPEKPPFLREVEYNAVSNKAKYVEHLLYGTLEETMGLSGTNRLRAAPIKMKPYGAPLLHFAPVQSTDSVLSTVSLVRWDKDMRNRFVLARLNRASEVSSANLYGYVEALVGSFDNEVNGGIRLIALSTNGGTDGEGERPYYIHNLSNMGTGGQVAPIRLTQGTAAGTDTVYRSIAIVPGGFFVCGWRRTGESFIPILQKFDYTGALLFSSTVNTAHAYAGAMTYFEADDSEYVYFVCQNTVNNLNLYPSDQTDDRLHVYRVSASAPAEENIEELRVIEYSRGVRANIGELSWHPSLYVDNGVVKKGVAINYGELYDIPFYSAFDPVNTKIVNGQWGGTKLIASTTNSTTGDDFYGAGTGGPVRIIFQENQGV